MRVALALIISFLLTRVPLDYLEAWTSDLRVQWRKARPPTGKVATVAVDVQTVEGLKRDPNVKDHLLFLSYLSEAMPRAVVYVKSPETLQGDPEDLEAFARKSRQFNMFIVATDQLPIKGQENELRMGAPFEDLNLMPGPRTSDLTSFAKDDVTRRLIFSYHNSPTLHAFLAKTYNGFSYENGAAQENYVGLFEFLGTLQAYIDYRPTGTYKPTSFIKVLSGEYSPDEFRDKVVFVGSDTMMTSSDYVRTPYSRKVIAMSALEMHANMLDTLIANSAPQKAPFWLNIFLTALISILTVFVVLTARPTFGLLILLGTFFLFCSVCYLAFAFGNYWIAMAHPLLAIFICYYFFIPYRLIIENRQSWEYLQRNRLLIQVEELKSNFLRMMSHDLKTPLARIQGMTELVKKDPNPLSPKQEEAIDRISQSSHELSDFIGSVLSLGRIESKEIKLQLKSKDVNKLLTKVIFQCEYLAASKNIQIISEFEPLFSLKLDEDLIRQVFTNLIENAIKYSNENSKILVSTEESVGHLVVQVADQGIGIADCEIPHVFTKFYRSMEVKNSAIKGSGLGLYLARYFVELHSGTISAESVAGKGSTFTVKLPMVLESRKDLPA